MSATVAFCPACNGIFKSRAFPSGYGTVVEGCAEPCVFCGSQALTESNPSRLKSIVVEVLTTKEREAASTDRLSQILLRLARHEISPEVAAVEIDEIAPGLGSRVLSAVKEHGLVIVPLVLSALAVYATFEANNISREANQISREALDFAIEQAAEKAVTEEHGPLLKPEKHVPAKPGVNSPRPHRPVHKNRHIRRTEKAKKRREK